jgi:hypothetical protein
MKWLKLFLAAMLIAVGTTAVAAPPVVREERSASQVQPATRVKALLIGLTNDKGIGQGCATNLKAMELYLRGLPNFDPKTDLIVLQGDDVTADKILQTVAKMQVNRRDAVFCYYTGHAGYEEQQIQEILEDPSGGHVFQLPGKWLKRKTLLDALKAKGGQLTVLLSDSCNVPVTGLPDRADRPKGTDLLKDLGFDAPPVKSDRVEWDLLPEKKEPIQSRPFAELLLKYRGVVDVSGSSRDQYGWFNPDGGWFTIGLLRTLDDYAAEEQGGEQGSEDSGQVPQRVYHWTTVLERASKTASEIFQGRKQAILSLPEPTDEAAKTARHKLEGQEDQYPQVFEMNVKENAR